MHGAADVQQQQRGVALQEANGPGGTGGSENWGLELVMVESGQRVEGQGLLGWEGLLVGRDKLRLRAL